MLKRSAALLRPCAPYKFARPLFISFSLFAVLITTINAASIY